MNLFILDKDPVQAARYYQDLHVNKIIIEGSQLLAAAYSLERLAQPDCPRTQKGTPRVHGHYNHPMSKWVRENKINFKWALRHIEALSEEYTYRFEDVHYTHTFIEWCYNNFPELPEGQLTEHPQCFRISYPQCIVPGNPIQGYWNYYNIAKTSFKFKNKIVKATWTKRPIPPLFQPK